MLNLLGQIIQLKLQTNKNLKELGKQIFVFESQYGFPHEMFIEEFDKKKKLTNEDWLKIKMVYLDYLTEHKLKSGMEFNSKAHKKLQEKNKEIIRIKIN